MIDLVRRHPGIGLPRLRRRIPGLPRNSAAAFLRRLKRLVRKRRRRNWRRLRWLVPGAAWAIDGTWLDAPVAGGSRRALIVMELHGGNVLAFDPVRGERASDVVACLRRLIARHGTPLVLKADNGSAFRSGAVAALCCRHGITLLHSPVRRPRYNGACEVAGRWAKRRVMAAAALRGSPGRLESGDLDAAVTQVGALPQVTAEERERFLVAAQEQLLAVEQERGLVDRSALKDHVRRSLERVAVRRALEHCHILMIEGPPYRQWLPRREVS